MWYLRHKTPIIIIAWDVLRGVRTNQPPPFNRLTRLSAPGMPGNVVTWPKKAYDWSNEDVAYTQSQLSGARCIVDLESFHTSFPSNDNQYK